ncbi:T6SS immunity protein Tdi1 domain-containing protein [Pseudomonas sp. SC11]|uniref:T6SS immunity protein Tdi1 domain-containing protein n=1 Tax=Pseudomonas sp. SC11 TaxID=326927 RepID=UPI00399B8488
MALKNPLQRIKPDPDQGLGLFLGSSRKDSLSFDDEQGRPLFERALGQLGPVSVDEMYTFEPALCVGGKATIENLVKVKMDIQLMILDQLRR